MKICFITNTIFNPGGIERVLTVISGALAENGHDVTVLCTDDSKEKDSTLYNLSDRVNIDINGEIIKDRTFGQKVIRKGIHIFNNRIKKINFGETLLKAGIYPKRDELKKLEDYLNEKNFDYAVGVAGYYSIILALISKNINAKTIGWEHNTFKAYYETKGCYHWGEDTLFKKYLPKLDGCIVLTEDDRVQYEKKLNIKNCVCIYNPLSFKSEIKSSCQNKIILFAARLIREQKGLDYLIEAFKKISDKKPDWKLQIVGSGPDREFLVNAVKENNLEDKVELVPHTKNIEKYYQNASIFLSTSRWEGFGLVITEAMECGLPVVAFENSGPKEIIQDNVNGLLIEKGNTSEMAEKVLKLIDDEKLRLFIAKNAVKRAEDFNCANVISKWENYLKNL